MRTSRRRTAWLVSAALTVLGAGASGAGSAHASAPGCRVEYTITSEAEGAFTGDVRVTTLGARVDDWVLTWGFVPGQEISAADGATVEQTGTGVTATGTRGTSAVPARGSVTFAVTGSWTATNPPPTSFELNGTPCGSRTLNGTAGADGAPVPCPPPAVPRPSASAALAAPIKIWMAGDSTMQNPSGGVCPVGWGSQFGALFTSDATVVNRAIGGRSIQTWLYDPNVTSTPDSTGECVINPTTYSARWQEMLDSSTGMKAGDYLFIQFGINDGSTTCPRHVGPARYRELLGVMARAAIARGAHPVFLTPVAAITCSGSTATPNRGFVNETVAAGAADNVPVIDLQKLSVALYNSLGFCPNNGDYTSGALGAFFCNDHTHFDTEGARRIASVVATAVRNQGIALASYLR